MSIRINDAAGDPIVLITYDQDPFQVLARQIIERAQGPDQGPAVVIIPDLLAAPRLQQCLIEQAQRMHYDVPAVQINTLRGWMEQHVRIGVPVIGVHAGQLMLVEALMQYPGLFGEENPWRLADSLLDVFDDFTLRHFDLPNDLARFSEQLARAYGLGKFTPVGLGQEATIVHTLWHGWRKQLREEGVIDAQGAYLLKLKKSLASIKADTHFHLAGFHALLPAELTWCRTLLERNQLSLFVHGSVAPDVSATDYHPDAPLAALIYDYFNLDKTVYYNNNLISFINSSYALRGPALGERARAFSGQTPASPVAQRLSVCATQGAEQEANAIDIQVRRWLAEGKQSIGILTENRRLARRVRAVLERSGIVLQDAAGWALSTTSAATALERWLQTVEEDFAHLPLFDLLKSPFIFPERARRTHLSVVYRLEQTLTRANIGHGLLRYHRQLGSQPDPGAAGLEAPLTPASLLNEIEHAALPLLSLLKGHRHRPETLLNALHESLQRLGMKQALAADAAGDAVLQELDAMRQALTGRSLRMSWQEFRTWLRRGWEAINFRPVIGAPGAGGTVQLLDLAQSPLCRFDALIIASADREHLPGVAARSQFFNATVRRELGLPTPHDITVARFHHFRRMLEAAPQVLVTLRREQDGEAVIASPWVELLQSFHWLAYGDRLENKALGALIDAPRGESDDLPTAQGFPRVRLDPRLMPTTLTAGAYQQLMDCPYQFFAAQCLRLSPIEPIDEILEKSDYGMRVHRILEAFHGGVQGLPGPFAQPITEDTYAAAVTALEEISHAVFAQDIAANFLHRNWLTRWLAKIPGYIAWQMRRETAWTFVAGEVTAQRDDVIAGLALKGRLDRIDSNGAGLGIIDYKTGIIPYGDDIESGEAVQLPFYALLAEGVQHSSITDDKTGYPIARVEYLRLDGDKIKSEAVLEDAALRDLQQDLIQHLTLIRQELGAGAELPAWGDEKSCARCTMSGLCRKQAWALDIPGNAR